MSRNRSSKRKHSVHWFRKGLRLRNVKKISKKSFVFSQGGDWIKTLKNSFVDPDPLHETMKLIRAGQHIKINKNYQNIFFLKKSLFFSSIPRHNNKLINNKKNHSIEIFVWKIMKKKFSPIFGRIRIQMKIKRIHNTVEMLA